MIKQTMHIPFHARARYLLVLPETNKVQLQHSLGGILIVCNLDKEKPEGIIIDLQKGRFISVEALLNWRSHVLEEELSWKEID
jgi:hypothetical protein